MTEAEKTNPDLAEATVTLTRFECRALRLAAIFGTPKPTPPEIKSATDKLRAAERELTPGVEGEGDGEAD